jgi:predicted Zn-dependent protease
MRRLIVETLVMVMLAPGLVLAQSAVQKDKAERAKAALNAGSFAEAAGLYSELVKELPAVPGLKMNLGMAYYGGGRFKDAAKYLSMAVEGDPQLTQAWLLLGASLLETGRPQEAIRAILKYLAAKPGETEALQILGDAYLRTDQFQKSIDTFEQIARKTSDSPRAWFGLGRSYEGLAGVAFEKLEKAAPESSYWFALIADSRMAQKQYSSAFYFYKKASDKTPAPRGLHVSISRVYRETGHPDWAAEEEKRELALGEPDCAKEPLVCSFLAGKLHEVIELTRKQATPESYYWQAQACNVMALAAFSKLAELPSSVEVHELRAEINRNQGRHFEAVAELQKALQLAPDDPKLKKELAFALYLKRDYAAAKVLITELLKLDPDSGELNYLAGDILLYDQKVDQAVPFLEKAVKSSPDIMGAQSALGRAYMDLGEVAKAIPHLKIALPTDEDGSLHFQLSRAYQRTGQEQLAKETLAKYQEITRLKQSEEKRLLEEIKITPP